MYILEEILLGAGTWTNFFNMDIPAIFEFLYGDIGWSTLSPRQKELVCTYSLRFVDVSAGSFMMGAHPKDKDAEKNEHPRHHVGLMEESVNSYSCTQGLYASIMGRIRVGIRDCLSCR